MIGVASQLGHACVENGIMNRGPAHGDIFRIFPSGSSHVRGQQCTVAIGETEALFASRCSYAGNYTQNCLLIISVQTHALKFANLV